MSTPSRDARSIYRARNLAGIRRARTILALARTVELDRAAVGFGDDAPVIDIRVTTNGNGHTHPTTRRKPRE